MLQVTSNVHAYYEVPCIVTCRLANQQASDAVSKHARAALSLILNAALVG
jgi:hypothetical protein